MEQKLERGKSTGKRKTASSKKQESQSNWKNCVSK